MFCTSSFTLVLVGFSSRPTACTAALQCELSERRLQVLVAQGVERGSIASYISSNSF